MLDISKSIRNFNFKKKKKCLNATSSFKFVFQNRHPDKI